MYNLSFINRKLTGLQVFEMDKGYPAYHYQYYLCQFLNNVFRRLQYF